MKNIDTNLTSFAKLSSCKRYRYFLSREWDPQLPYLLFIGLNPSTADAEKNDRTTHKLIELVKSWKRYGGLIIVNLYAFIDTKQNEIWSLPSIEEMIGTKNREVIEDIINRDDIGMIIVGWGNNAVNWRGSKVVPDIYFQQIQDIYDFVLRKADKELYCLGYNQGGMPAHPLSSAIPYPQKEIMTPQLYTLKHIELSI